MMIYLFDYATPLSVEYMYNTPQIKPKARKPHANFVVGDSSRCVLVHHYQKISG